MLGKTVIIAGDGAGTDIGAGADRRVADISKMVDLRPLADSRLLDLDEIPDMRILSEIGAGPQPRERPDRRPFADPRLL